MVNYGYGGGYSTTTYGAQGGSDGGGFVGGSQGGSQDNTPGGAKTHGKETVRPVTIKQILDAVIPHPGAEPKIDGIDITQLSFIGQVLQVTKQTTNNTIKIDDGTGVVEVKQWVDADAPEETKKPIPNEGVYVHVWGRLKDFNGKRTIQSHVIRPITDFNEVNCHLLEATAVHLYFTRGPPESAQNRIKTEGGLMVDGGHGGAAGGGTHNGHRTLPARISAHGRQLFEFLHSAPQGNEGLHVQQISQQCQLPINDVFKAGDELLQDGLIYTTVDDETWAILEYE